MKRQELKEEARVKFLLHDTCQAPIETSLPPLNSKSKLFSVIEKNKFAEVELRAKHILSRTPKASIEGIWNQIAQDRNLLRNLFIDNNDTINEHKASRYRFKEIIRDNAKHKISVCDEIRKMQLEKADYIEVKAHMEQYVSDYSVYENFLRCVAQTGPEFNSVGNVLNRFETLEHTRNECVKLLQKELDEANQLRKDMETMTENKNLQLKSLTNKLIMMQVQQKEAKERRLYWETILKRIKRVMELKEEEIVILGGGTWDLYRKMCARRKMPVILSESDVNGQMDFIKNTIMFYKEVNTIASTAKHD